MKIKGLAIGGKMGLCPEMRVVRRIPLLSYHNPKHTNWLWGLDLRRAISDEWRGFRYLGPSPFEKTWTLQFWNWSIVFAWQESGKYTDYSHQRRSKLSRLFGVDFD